MPNDRVARERAARMDLIEKLWKLHQAERLSYLFATFFALGLLAWAFVSLLDRGELGVSEVIMFVGSGGAVGAACGQMLKMWSTALKIVFGDLAGGP